MAKKVFAFCFILFSFIILAQVNIVLQVTAQGIGNPTTTTQTSIFPPLTDPPICEQAIPYRVVPPQNVIPGQNHTIFFEYCSIDNPIVDIIPELMIRTIGGTDSDWVRVNMTLTTWTHVAENKNEFIFRGKYFFANCSAIEGKFRILQLADLSPLTDWQFVEIPREWGCGVSGGTGLSSSNSALVIIILVIGAGAAIAFVGNKIRIKNMNKPKLIGHENFVRLEHVSYSLIRDDKGLKKKYRIVKNSPTSIEFYRKDGRPMQDEDIQTIRKNLLDRQIKV